MRLGKQQKQAGFTLVEIAVVLVIIGLIIAAVLTAQQVTQNGKITNTIQTIKSYQAAAQSYNQNYGALPGDDAQQKNRFSNVADNGNGNGAIGLSGDGFAVADGAADASKESRLFWNALRAANLIKGDGTSANPPGNAFGGAFAVQDGAFSGGLAVGTNVLCLNHISGAAAIAIDQQLDDGLPDKGNIKGGESVTGAVTATAYDAAKSYVLCTPL